MNIIYDLGDKVTYIFLVTCNENSSSAFDGIIPGDIKDRSGGVFRLKNILPVGTDKQIIQSRVHEILVCAKKLTTTYKWI
jgi:hypothetical protein